MATIKEWRDSLQKKDMEDLRSIKTALENRSLLLWDLFFSEYASDFKVLGEIVSHEMWLRKEAERNS